MDTDLTEMRDSEIWTGAEWAAIGLGREAESGRVQIIG